MKENRSIRTYTGIFILFFLIGVVFWDAYAFMFGGQNSTISVILTDIAENNVGFAVIVSNVMGMLVGHFFIPPIGSKKDKL